MFLSVIPSFKLQHRSTVTLYNFTRGATFSEISILTLDKLLSSFIIVKKGENGFHWEVTDGYRIS